MISNRPNIYLASPLFSPQERQFNAILRDRLAPMSDVYLPQEDGSLLVDLVAAGMTVSEAKHTIFSADIRAIERCDILLIVMDGRVIDEGACFELGYAYKCGKLCVGLKTDVRVLLPIGDNPMIDCALRKIFRDIDSVCDWVQTRGWDWH
jgi:nucleoside 2-deoxyribosyltransferase